MRVEAFDRPLFLSQANGQSKPRPAKSALNAGDTRGDTALCPGLNIARWIHGLVIATTEVPSSPVTASTRRGSVRSAVLKVAVKWIGSSISRGQYRR